MSGHPVTMRSTGDSGWARLDSRDNALNAVRFALAAVVLVKHSWNAAHGAAGPLPYAASFAVDCFFAISGYLIAGSRTRQAFAPFLWRRALRILPGLWAALLLTAFVLAPVAATLANRPMDWTESASYVLNNGSLLMTQHTIGDTLAATPVGEWNASTWTLPYEVLAYLAFGAVLTCKAFGRRSSVVSCGILAIVTLAFWTPGSPIPAELGHLIRLLSFFAGGAALWFWRDRLPERGWWAAAAATVAGVLVCWSYPMYALLAPVPVAFLMLWLGSHAHIRLGSVHDLSYGMYVLAFPVTQLLIVLGAAPALGDVGFALAVMACTLPLAAASWFLIERPMLRWGRTHQRSGVMPATMVQDPSSSLTFSG